MLRTSTNIHDVRDVTVKTHAFENDRGGITRWTTFTFATEDGNHFRITAFHDAETLPVSFK